MNSQGSSEVSALVLGGGIFGAAVSYHLSRMGVTSLSLVDRDTAGRGATLRSAGILTYQGWGPWDARLVQESAGEYEALSDRTGRGRYLRNGGLRVARTSEGERWLARIAEVLQTAGVATRSFGPSEVGRALPTADLDDVRSGLLTPGDATFDTPEMTSTYASLAARQGVQLHSIAEIPRVARHGDRWQISTRGRRWSTPILIVACGAWTKSVLAGMGHPLPLAPFRAQASLLRPTPLSPVFPTLHDLDLNLYVRPAGMGRVLVGDGTGPSEVDPETAEYHADKDYEEGVRSRLQLLYPGWKKLHPEQAWAGVCVASPDRYPLVGKVPGAPGLFVATGFNGFGAMRTPALARRLAEGILTENWGPLTPADPGRFPSDLGSFPPRPDFPLRDDGTLDPREERPHPSEPAPVLLEMEVPEVHYRSLVRDDAVDQVHLPPLSEWFDPFLPLFMKDALRCGGEVQLAEEAGEIRGVYLHSPTENTGSIFTRVRAIAEHFLPLHPRGELYAEHPWWTAGIPVHVMLACLEDWEEREHPVRSVVRIGTGDDLPRVSALIREAQGPVDEVWFRTLPREDERCFLCEVEGRLVGVSWLSLAGRYARGHSLAVHPRYRGLGVATDLLAARMRWLKERGVRQVVSEIYGENRASRTAAERAGMSEVGTMYAFHRD